MNPRNANGSRRRKLRARVLAEEDHCHLCGGPVDKTLPPHLDGSPEIDEIIPIAYGGNPYLRSNCRLSHRLCNVRRGKRLLDETTAPLRERRYQTALTW